MARPAWPACAAITRPAATSALRKPVGSLAIRSWMRNASSASLSYGRPPRYPETRS
ncbi:hypothetical protein ACFQ1L_20050 [Phytohabitans flavus]|uniref:hypothetical protein n=1 Tax=Phytohabitans flavus TaxID=1076124 RepID=UPI00363AB50C